MTEKEERIVEESEIENRNMDRNRNRNYDRNSSRQLVCSEYCSVIVFHRGQSDEQ